MTDNYKLHGVLYKTKMIISTNKFNYTEIKIDTDDKLANQFVLKNVLVLISCVLKDGDKC